MHNPYSLEGRRVLVTGAAQGIGREVAQLVTSLGGKVGAIDLNGDGLKTLAEGGGDLKTYTGSVTDQSFIDSVVEDMVKEWGGVDGLFNNAGIVRAAMIHKMSRQQWDEVIGVNLTGVFLALQSVGRHRSEEHTSELQSLMRISYAVFCLKKTHKHTN